VSIDDEVQKNSSLRSRRFLSIFQAGNRASERTNEHAWGEQKWEEAGGGEQKRGRSGREWKELESLWPPVFSLPMRARVDRN